MGGGRIAVFSALVLAPATGLVPGRSWMAPHAWATAPAARPAVRVAMEATSEGTKTKVTVRVRPKGERKAAAAAPAASEAVDMATTVTVKAPDAAPVVQVAEPSLATANLSKADELLLEGTTKANCTTMLRALQEGADPNVRDPKGRTPLHFVAGLGLAPAAVLLVHYGAQLDVRDGEELTPMHMAAGYANAQTLRVLVAAGADTTLIGQRQGTPLQIVLQLGDYQLTQFLNRTGADRLKKKDDKLEKLKACLDIFDDVEGVREAECWEDMMTEVLTTIADVPDDE